MTRSTLGRCALLLLLAGCGARPSDAVPEARTLSVVVASEAVVDVPAVEPVSEAPSPTEGESVAEGSAVESAVSVEAAPEQSAPSDRAETPNHPPSQACNYTTYQWSMKRKTGVNRRTISKTFGALSGDEIDPNDPRCSVCEENQVWLRPAEHGWPNIKPIRVCDVYAGKLASALEEMAKAGNFTIVDMEGYRPGRTRGAVVDGLRTQMSNHGYGTAIDINARHNGLYAGCNIKPVTVEALRRCRLAVGGAWDPVARPATTVVRDGTPYRVMVQSVGWKWGGEIPGSTRDLMHFSLTGF